MQRLAHAHAGSRQERVGNAAADDQLVDLLEQRLEHSQLGRDLRAAHDGNQRPRRFLERRLQRFELTHQQRPRTGNLGELGHAMRAGFRAMRRAERIHHEHIAQLGHLPRELLVVLLLALVEANVLAQHGAARRAIHAVEPVLAQRDRLAEQLRQAASATGASDKDSSYLPSSGRPRCERMNTFAF